jgi:hypothetical protein
LLQYWAPVTGKNIRRLRDWAEIDIKITAVYDWQRSSQYEVEAASDGADHLPTSWAGSNVDG